MYGYEYFLVKKQNQAWEAGKNWLRLSAPAPRKPQSRAGVRSLSFGVEQPGAEHQGVSLGAKQKTSGAELMSSKEGASFRARVFQYFHVPGSWLIHSFSRFVDSNHSDDQNFKTRR